MLVVIIDYYLYYYYGLINLNGRYPCPCCVLLTCTMYVYNCKGLYVIKVFAYITDGRVGGEWHICTDWASTSI